MEGRVQKGVPNTELPKLFEAGWTFKASLSDRQSMVEVPTRAWGTRED